MLVTATCGCCHQSLREPTIRWHRHRDCPVHGDAPLVPYPPPLHEPGGEDCAGPTVTRAIDEWARRGCDKRS